MLVIGDRSLRFNEIKRSIEGISPKVLSNSLKNNERFGFILREVKSEKQIEVHYRLTKLGHEMIETIYPLIKLAELRMTSIDSCQNNYDNDSE